MRRGAGLLQSCHWEVARDLFASRSLLFLKIENMLCYALPFFCRCCHPDTKRLSRNLPYDPQGNLVVSGGLSQKEGVRVRFWKGRITEGGWFSVDGCD